MDPFGSPGPQNGRKNVSSTPSPAPTRRAASSSTPRTPTHNSSMNLSSSYNGMPGSRPASTSPPSRPGSRVGNDSLLPDEAVLFFDEDVDDEELGPNGMDIDEIDSDEETGPPPTPDWSKIKKVRAETEEEAIELNATMTKVYDEMQQYLESIPKAPQPSALACPLLDHQKQAVWWMGEQENKGSLRAGILGDDMGVGKTLETLGLLCAKRLANTLIVCPMTMVNHWKSEIERHVLPNTFKVIVYYGQTRPKDLATLRSGNIVITTYGTVSAEYKKLTKLGMTDEGLSEGRPFDAATTRALPVGRPILLYCVPWARVVLDEAQYIKNRFSISARACRALPGTYRWALSGTPISNSLDDLFSLILFLRWPDYPDAKEWNAFIKKPVANNQPAGYQELTKLIKRCMLRRRKNQILNGRPIVELPGITSNTTELDFPEEDKIFYMATEQRIMDQFDALANRGQAYVMRNYTHVLVLLLRLRQAACHPYLVAMAYEEEAVARNRSWDFDALESWTQKLVSTLQQARKDVVDEVQTSDNITEQQLMQKVSERVSMSFITNGTGTSCLSCGKPADDPVITPCNHIFCSACLPDQMYSICPHCKTTFGTAVGNGLRHATPAQLREAHEMETLKGQVSPRKAISVLSPPSVAKLTVKADPASAPITNYFPPRGPPNVIVLDDSDDDSFEEILAAKTPFDLLKSAKFAPGLMTMKEDPGTPVTSTSLPQSPTLHAASAFGPTISSTPPLYPSKTTKTAVKSQQPTPVSTPAPRPVVHAPPSNGNNMVISRARLRDNTMFRPVIGKSGPSFAPNPSSLTSTPPSSAGGSHSDESNGNAMVQESNLQRAATIKVDPIPVSQPPPPVLRGNSGITKIDSDSEDDTTRPSQYNDGYDTDYAGDEEVPREIIAEPKSLAHESSRSMLTEEDEMALAMEESRIIAEQQANGADDIPPEILEESLRLSRQASADVSETPAVNVKMEVDSDEPLVTAVSAPSAKQASTSSNSNTFDSVPIDIPLPALPSRRRRGRNGDVDDLEGEESDRSEDDVDDGDDLDGFVVDDDEDVYEGYTPSTKKTPSQTRSKKHAEDPVIISSDDSKSPSPAPTRKRSKTREAEDEDYVLPTPVKAENGEDKPVAKKGGRAATGTTSKKSKLTAEEKIKPEAFVHNFGKIVVDEDPSAADVKLPSFRFKGQDGAKKTRAQDLKRHAAKLSALLTSLELVKTAGTDDKIVIYSQFTRYLDIIAVPLRDWGWKTSRLDGTMNQKERTAVLHAFDHDPSVRILIVSLKAAGVGINLTVANHIFLMDPWWNTAVENQAIDRVHRIGQKKPIFVTRFVIKQSVEARIIAIQADKDRVTDRALSNRRGDAPPKAGLTFAQLRQLFSSSFTTNRPVMDTAAAANLFNPRERPGGRPVPDEFAFQRQIQAMPPSSDANGAGASSSTTTNGNHTASASHVAQPAPNRGHGLGNHQSAPTPSGNAAEEFDPYRPL